MGLGRFRGVLSCGCVTRPLSASSRALLITTSRCGSQVGASVCAWRKLASYLHGVGCSLAILRHQMEDAAGLVVFAFSTMVPPGRCAVQVAAGDLENRSGWVESSWVDATLTRAHEDARLQRTTPSLTRSLPAGDVPWVRTVAVSIAGECGRPPPSAFRLPPSALRLPSPVPRPLTIMAEFRIHGPRTSKLGP